MRTPHTPTFEERIEVTVIKYRLPLMILLNIILLLLIVALIKVVCPPLESGAWYNHALAGRY